MRNEMLGLPKRRILKAGAVPVNFSELNTQCSYPNCPVLVTDAYISFHELPEEASEMQKKKWLEIVPAALEKPRQK